MDIRHVPAWSAVLILGCASSPLGEQPGYETGPCIENQCFDDLVCHSDLCVEADEDDDEDDGPTSSNSGSASNPFPDSDSDPDSASGPVPTGSASGSESESASASASASASDSASDTALESSSTTGSHDDDSDSDVTSGPGSTTGFVGCGDGEVEPGEQCDGDDLQGFDCASLGLGGGTLECDPITCTFDTSMCMSTSSGTDT